MTASAEPAPAAPALPPDELDDESVDLIERYRKVRDRTQRLAEPLSPEDCAVQSMDDASPVKWHLAHTTWFFETFVLERAAPGYRHYRPEFRFLFNSYYHSVGDQYPRPERGLLTRPGLDQVLAFRAHVDRHVETLLSKGLDLDAKLREIVRLGLHHEQQHQELILTDIKHALSHNPTHPAYCQAPERAERSSVPLTWHALEGGVHWMGHQGGRFAFDNEGPRHRTLLEPFELASRPVTNREYLAFIDDGGYERPECWLSDGWATSRSGGWSAPLYWECRDGWSAVTLSGLQPLDPEEPVTHVSLYEADAYARWAGARLPSEAEWECAAASQTVEGNFVEGGRFHPAQAPPKSAEGLVQMFGDVWEWTRSPYGPYPGYRPAQGALGEYNGKFMCNQLTLRGGSCATPRSHARATYRNFFLPHARWQFSGIRLARDPS